MIGFKNIVATLYLKNGQAVKSASDMTVMGDVYNLCQLYNDSGIDKIIIFDLSTDDDEHEKNIHTIENINRNIDIKVCAGGNINRIEDVKKLLEVLQRLVDEGNTVLVIEHNLDVIKCADYLIDLGPEGGSGGGTVVATGTPEEVAGIEASYTGQYLKKVLK